MRDKRATFALFYPEPMDEIDRTNLMVSGVSRIQMFFLTAYVLKDQLRWLQSQGIRVSLRLDEPNRDDADGIARSYYNTATHGEIKRKLIEMKGLVNVEAVICGNEPEIEYDLTRGSPNWGNNPEPNFPLGKAFHHQYALGQLRSMLEGSGTVLVTPGWSHKRVVPRQPPQPGRSVWERICAIEYNKCAAGGVHVYAYGWESDEDVNRYLWHAGIELGRVQTAAWWNETNTDNKRLTPLDRMHACLAMYEQMAQQNWSEPIKSFCPFVSNGRAGQSWSHMIMRDPACYTLLGQWMAT